MKKMEKKEQGEIRMNKKGGRKKHKEDTRRLVEENGNGRKQQEDRISFRIILVVRVVGLILVGGVFFYIMYGLWLVPVSETVEESPVYLYESLHLIIIVLAVLVSYKISFGDDEVVELLKEIRDRQPLRNEDPSHSNGNDKASQRESRDTCRQPLRNGDPSHSPTSSISNGSDKREPRDKEMEPLSKSRGRHMNRKKRQN